MDSNSTGTEVTTTARPGVTFHVDAPATVALSQPGRLVLTSPDGQPLTVDADTVRLTIDDQRWAEFTAEKCLGGADGRCGCGLPLWQHCAECMDCSRLGEPCWCAS